MTCGNCNQEIAYDTETVARHLDGKCNGLERLRPPGHIIGYNIAIDGMDISKIRKAIFDAIATGGKKKT